MRSRPVREDAMREEVDNELQGLLEKELETIRLKAAMLGAFVKSKGLKDEYVTFVESCFEKDKEEE